MSKKRNRIPRRLFPTQQELRDRRELASLRAIVKSPRGGPMTEYLRKKAKIDLICYEMSGRLPSR